ncbi:MAG: DNA cytosine methyltransferase [Cardiobacteriaceae bacterium]|nr:DNA cytosine methyltransferase [Cardiobacteriaceae bacterium]
MQLALNSNFYDASSKNIVNWINISNEMLNINAWNNKKDLSKYNFVDLFSGAGGLSCGLLMAGFQPIAAVEIMETAVASYKHNFIEKQHFDELVEIQDIRKQETKNRLYDKVKNKKIHLIAGGFPCQGFSIAGLRKIDDERNCLYREMLEIVKHIQPDFVLMENVPGLRSMLNGQVEEKIIQDYADIGYKINVAILNAADYGVAQIRKRIIFIGNKIGAKNYHPSAIFKEEEYKTVAQELARFSNIKENKEINHIFTKHSSKMLEKIKNTKPGDSVYDNYSDSWKRVYADKPSSTIKENHGGVNIHPIEDRVMTPRELAALQSFPDDFIFKGAKKWQLVQIGNAVPPLLGKAIGLAILKSIKEMEK